MKDLFKKVKFLFRLFFDICKILFASNSYKDFIDNLLYDIVFLINRKSGLLFQDKKDILKLWQSATVVTGEKNKLEHPDEHELPHWMAKSDDYPSNKK